MKTKPKKPKPAKKPLSLWVIYGDGWLWNGISPFVSSTMPDREIGITFPTKPAALAMAKQLMGRSWNTRRWTVRQA
jgi:hypothetical protein